MQYKNFRDNLGFITEYNNYLHQIWTSIQRHYQYTNHLLYSETETSMGENKREPAMQSYSQGLYEQFLLLFFSFNGQHC